jgi:hypothetical protein
MPALPIQFSTNVSLESAGSRPEPKRRFTDPGEAPFGNEQIKIF